VKKYLIILFLVSSGVSFAGPVDSLLKLIPTHKQDTLLVLLYSNLITKYDDIGDYDKAIAFGLKAEKLADSLNYKFGLQSACNNIGNCYMDRGNIKTALEYHLKTLKIREELGLKRGVGYTYLNLGNIYFRMGNDGQALKTYIQSMNILLAAGDTLRVASCFSNMGSIYSNKQQPVKAEEYYLKSLEIRKHFGDDDGVAETYSNLSVILMDARKYKQALVYAFKTIDLYGAAGNKLGKVISYSNIGDIYEHMGEYSNAIKYQSIALQHAIEMKSVYMMKPCYQLLAVAYDKKNDYKNALHYAELYSNLNDSVMNTENAKVITEMQARFETEKKEKAIELLRKDKNIRELHMGEQEANIHRQRIIIYSVIGGLILIIVLIFFIWKSYREKKKINIGLERKNTEINIQKNLIEEKNIFITDSIDSARNIQNAILPPDEIINKHIPDSFFLFMPKDIVSGDFYWLSAPTDDCVLLASVDCTGHGVPGAFMSVMAFNMLENIIADKKLSQPSLILDELNKTVPETLHQETENSSAKYGMDISLISISKNEIQFAGAHNSLCIVNQDRLIEIKADKVTIGMATEKFTNHTIEVQKGGMLYMFTDGYPDQKGGPQNKKFFAGEFKNILSSVAQKNTPEQKEILQKTFSDWKGNNEQIDDVLVIGIRI
jgi:serine phosphatase RsbU (regulator of sigma subunit)/tetratricopeptide (TPR) repeat protein